MAKKSRKALTLVGTWRVDGSYGNVWVPNRVAVGWAPYRDGHWAWVDPWGWTWVDDAPWGFAVSHYGRWANFHGRWGWVPGPVRILRFYASTGSIDTLSPTLAACTHSSLPGGRAIASIPRRSGSRAASSRPRLRRRLSTKSATGAATAVSRR